MEMAWLEWKEITLAILRKIVKIHKGFPPLSSTPFPSLWPNLVIIFRHLLFTKKLNFGKHLIAPTFHVKQVVSRIKLRLAFFVILFFFVVEIFVFTMFKLRREFYAVCISTNFNSATFRKECLEYRYFKK